MSCVFIVVFFFFFSFFVVEDTILHTTQSLTKMGAREVGDESLITQKIVNEFWSMAQDEALAVLRSNCVSLWCSVCCCRVFSVIMSNHELRRVLVGTTTCS